MPRPSDREIDESFDRAGYDYDPDGEALLRHVLLDDEPPQGLHRGGLKMYEPEEWEFDAIADYYNSADDNYGGLMGGGFE